MVDDLNRIGSFLARRDMDDLCAAPAGVEFDVLMLAGSSLLAPLYLAASAIKDGIVARIVVSGGVGHSTSFLHEAVAHSPEFSSVLTEGRAEADIIRDILIDFLAVEPKKITVENKSTNCGANAEETRRMLDGLNVPISRLLLMQDPTMQRRTHASCERSWSGTKTKVFSYSPFVPVVTSHGDTYGVEGGGTSTWPFARYLSLMLGEIVRLRDDKNGYGPRGSGFIDHVHIPDLILKSYQRVRDHFGNFERSVGIAGK